MIQKPISIEKNIFKGCHININDEDVVKISIKKDEASIQELDMAPYLWVDIIFISVLLVRLM